MALVAIDLGRRRLPPMSHRRVPRGDHPLRRDPGGDPHAPGWGGFRVLRGDRGQERHRLLQPLRSRPRAGVPRRTDRTGRPQLLQQGGARRSPSAAGRAPEIPPPPQSASSAAAPGPCPWPRPRCGPGTASSARSGFRDCGLRPARTSPGHRQTLPRPLRGRIRPGAAAAGAGATQRMAESTAAPSPGTSPRSPHLGCGRPSRRGRRGNPLVSFIRIGKRGLGERRPSLGIPPRSQLIQLSRTPRPDAILRGVYHTIPDMTTPINPLGPQSESGPRVARVQAAAGAPDGVAWTPDAPWPDAEPAPGGAPKRSARDRTGLSRADSRRRITLISAGSRATPGTAS